MGMKKVNIDKIKPMDIESKNENIKLLRSIPQVCQECVEDDLIKAVKNVDGICYHCGKKFCATHFILHLKEVECVELEHLHLDLENIDENI